MVKIKIQISRFALWSSGLTDFENQCRAREKIIVIVVAVVVVVVIAYHWKLERAPGRIHYRPNVPLTHKTVMNRHRRKDR